MVKKVVNRKRNIKKTVVVSRRRLEKTMIDRIIREQKYKGGMPCSFSVGYRAGIFDVHWDTFPKSHGRFSERLQKVL